MDRVEFVSGWHLLSVFEAVLFLCSSFLLSSFTFILAFEFLFAFLIVFALLFLLMLLLFLTSLSVLYLLVLILLFLFAIGLSLFFFLLLCLCRKSFLSLCVWFVRFLLMLLTTFFHSFLRSFISSLTHFRVFSFFVLFFPSLFYFPPSVLFFSGSVLF